MIKVLVTGAAGQVGRDLVDVLLGYTPPGGSETWHPDGRAVHSDEFAVVGLTHHDLDVTDEAAVHRAIRAVQPDVIVHLAAYTAVDQAESDSERCFAVNERGTGYLSDAADSTGAHLVTVSTDYVFDGAGNRPYSESDTTNPLGVYGRSKLAGELRCRPRDTIVRTSWVMGIRGRNVLHVIAQRVAAGEPVRFVNDQIGTPTFSADLARGLATFVRERPSGVWHFANQPATSWYEVAVSAAEACGATRDFVTPITSGELTPAPAARRPSYSALSTEKWVAAGFREPLEWRDGLARFFRDRS